MWLLNFLLQGATGLRHQTQWCLFMKVVNFHHSWRSICVILKKAPIRSCVSRLLIFYESITQDLDAELCGLRIRLSLLCCMERVVGTMQASRDDAWKSLRCKHIVTMQHIVTMNGVVTTHAGTSLRCRHIITTEAHRYDAGTSLWCRHIVTMQAHRYDAGTSLRCRHIVTMQAHRYDAGTSLRCRLIVKMPSHRYDAIIICKFNKNEERKNIFCKM